MSSLSLRELPDVPDDVEVVEHKGIGHPDTLCDGVAEAASRALSRAYLERHGTILHHNVDKALLVGGQSSARLGGGDVTTPMLLHLAGRAAGEEAAEIVVEAARSWLRGTVHALDVDRHVRIDAFLRHGSTDLVDLFARGRRANDTSIGAGYAPLSPVEHTVLEIARRLRALSTAPEGRDVGEDTKVLAVRRGRRVELTVACAFIGPEIASLERYVARRDAVRALACEAAGDVLRGDLEVDVVVNAADDVGRGSVYVTVTGTSAESGDDGQVGRGNRVNGLITPCRPMTLEAAAGKNAVTHVGKLYNVTAHGLASEIVTRVPEVTRAECLLTSRIGLPIDQPSLVDVRVGVRRGASLAALRPQIADIVAAKVAAIPSLWEPILRGEVRLF